MTHIHNSDCAGEDALDNPIMTDQVISGNNNMIPPVDPGVWQSCSSPFMIDTGQNPLLGIEPLRESHLEMLNDFASGMEAAMKEACSALSRAADIMAHFYDTHRREAPLYVIGDKVWINGQNITTTHP